MHGLGCIGTCMIAGHHHRGPAHNFPHRAGRHFFAIFINDLDLGTGGRSSHRVQFFGEFMGHQRTRPAPFSQAVKLDQPAGPAIQDLTLDRSAQWCGRGQLHLKRPQIRTLKSWMGKKALILHRYQHGVRGPCFRS